MDDKKEQDTFLSETKDTVQTVPLAYHEVCMNRNHKTLFRLIIAWAATILLVVGGFIWMWFQYDYTSTEEYTGVYVLRDSEGNVISADIQPDDMIKILEVLESGKSADNTSQGTQ